MAKGVAVRVVRVMDHLEGQVRRLQSDCVELRQQLVAIVEENNRLWMENRRLVRAKGNAPVGEIGEGSGVSTGGDQLRSLYEEGFHICNVHYGRLRDRLERDCMLCLSFLTQGDEAPG